MPSTSISLSGIDDSLQREAELIFTREGLSASDVYRRLLLRTIQQKYIPLDLFQPNEETLEAMRELDRGEGRSFHSVDALMADLNADD